MKRGIIGKTALLTAGLLIAIAIVIFAILSIAFPGTLAEFFEKTGNYSLAVGYASLHYTYTGTTEDAAECAQDSILSKNNNYIIRYGTQFIDDSGFEDYCKEQDEYYYTEYGMEYSYKQYIYGEVACAYYAQGNTQSAVGCVLEALDSGFSRSSYTTDGANSYTINGFADSNALISLSLKVIDKYDDGAAGIIVEILGNITAEGEELSRLTQFTEIMQQVADGTYQSP